MAFKHTLLCLLLAPKNCRRRALLSERRTSFGSMIITFAFCIICNLLPSLFSQRLYLCSKWVSVCHWRCTHRLVHFSRAGSTRFTRSKQEENFISSALQQQALQLTVCNENQIGSVLGAVLWIRNGTTSNFDLFFATAPANMTFTRWQNLKKNAQNFQSWEAVIRFIRRLRVCTSDSSLQTVGNHHGGRLSLCEGQKRCMQPVGDNSDSWGPVIAAAGKQALWRSVSPLTILESIWRSWQECTTYSPILATWHHAFLHENLEGAKSPT